VRRDGRLTPSQERALGELWPAFGIAYFEQPLDLDSVFGRAAPRVLEIGFGNGETLVEMAAADPATDFIGIEVHKPGVGHCLLCADAAGISNLRLIRHDAVEVLTQQIPDTSLRRINLYFPDPWPKKRHHKRRILQPEFLQLLSRKIEPGGTLHIATDWQNYAEQIDELIESQEGFRVSARRVHSGDEPLDRPTTKFERRGLGLGHRVWDWRLGRI
jgi:tRNA (guanine-N7-)-methyltransferase